MLVFFTGLGLLRFIALAFKLDKDVVAFFAAVEEDDGAL